MIHVAANSYLVRQSCKMMMIILPWQNSTKWYLLNIKIHSCLVSWEWVVAIHLWGKTVVKHKRVDRTTVLFWYCVGCTWRKVIIPTGSQLLAGDHDFTKYSIVPFVVILIEIPEEISGSWYSWHDLVMLKQRTFQPSSPAHTSTELATIIECNAPNLPVLFMYLFRWWSRSPADILLSQ